MQLREAVYAFRDAMTGANPKDKPAIGEAWSIYVDNLHRTGMITDAQAHDWCLPESFTLPALPEEGDVCRSRRDGTPAYVDEVKGGQIYYRRDGVDHSANVNEFMQSYKKVKGL
jgi:hypothetical protein